MTMIKLPDSLDPTRNGKVLQDSIYIGINIANVLYGIELVFCFKTIYIVLSNKRTRKKYDTIYALLSSIMVFLNTVWVASQAEFGRQMWLRNADFPGGFDAYWKKHISDWYMDWGITAIIVLQLMTDGLMIYRCRIVWNSNWIIVLPTILWLATLVLGVLMDWNSSSPGGSILTGIASELGLAYWSVSVFLNTILTCMICCRLVRHGKQVQEHLGREYASLYFRISTIIVESVFPYTACGIAFLVSYGMGSPTSVVFCSVYMVMMCISPQMLIFRVIMGRAWDSDASQLRHSTIQFKHASTSWPQALESAEVKQHMQVSSNLNLSDGHERV